MLPARLLHLVIFDRSYKYLSYDVASESDITPCNKINTPLVVYRFTGNVMTSIMSNFNVAYIMTTFVRQESDFKVFVIL